MIESYTKEGGGRSVQFARGTFSALEMTERGLATIDDDGTFTALPLEGDGERFDGGLDIDDLAASILDLQARNVAVERLALSAGIATHEIRDAAGERSWITTHYRAYASLTRADIGVRLRIQSGGTSPADVDASHVALIADALAGCRRGSSLNGTVGLPADLVARIASEAAHGIVVLPPHLQMVQRAPADEPLDGRGLSIEAAALTPSQRPPNVFRPSYRLQPVRVPMHVALVSSNVATASPAIRAIAGDLELRGESACLTLLCSGDDGALLHELELPFSTVLSGLSVAEEGARWLPFAAGAWGTEGELRLPD